MLQKLFYSVFYFVFALFILIWITATFFLTPIANIALKDFDLQVQDGGRITFDPVQFALDIRDFKLIHKNTELVEFEHLIVDIAALPMLKGDISLHQIYLEGLVAKIKMQEQKVLLNDVDLLAIFSDGTQAQVSNSPTNTTEPTDSSTAMDVAIDNLTLKDLHIEFKQNTMSSVVDIENYQLDDLEFDGQELSLETDLVARIQLSIDEPNNPIALDTGLQFTTQLNVTLGDNINAVIDDFLVETNNTTVAVAGYQVENKRFQIDSDEIIFSLTGQTPSHVAASFNIQQQQLVVAPQEAANATSQPTGQTLLLEQLDFNNLIVSNDVNAEIFTPQVTLEQLKLTSLIAMQGNEETPPLLNLTGAEINTIYASQSRIDIDEVVLAQMNLDATLAKDKQLSPLFIATADTPSGSESHHDKQTQVTSNGETDADVNNTVTAEANGAQKETATTQSEVSQTVAPPIAIRLGRFVAIDPIDIRFLDLSVAPAFKSHLVVHKLSLSEVNSEAPETISKFVLNATLDQYSKISTLADLQPFLSKPQFTINLDVDELSLPELSPYVSSALGYNIESGQLDTKMLIKINDRKLSGNSLTHLKSMELNALEESGEKNNMSGGAISFNAALGMLKDGNDVVELDIPIKGDLDKPSVGLSGIMSLVIKQATMSAAKDYLITTFLPYSQVIKIAMSASDHLLKLKFEPLIFSLNSADFQDDQKEYIEQLAAALVKNKDINIKLCPIATPQELMESNDKESRLALAKQRGAMLKTKLIDDFGIASKRLYSCTAKIDADEEAQPRIEIDQL